LAGFIPVIPDFVPESIFEFDIRRWLHPKGISSCCFQQHSGTDSKLLFLARPRKSNQKESRPKTYWDFQPQFPHLKRKTGARELARCSALYRAQTNARIDPVFIWMFGCV